MFLLLHRVKYRKRYCWVPVLISGTDTGNVPVQMWTVPNPSKFTWTCLQLQEYDAPGVEHIPVVQIDLSVPLKVPGEQIYNP